MFASSSLVAKLEPGVTSTTHTERQMTSCCLTLEHTQFLVPNSHYNLMCRGVAGWEKARPKSKAAPKESKSKIVGLNYWIIQDINHTKPSHVFGC